MHDPFSPSRPASAPLTLADAAAIMGQESDLPTARRPAVVVEATELTSEEIFDGRARELALGVHHGPIQRIRHTHHLAAQCIAEGMSRIMTAARTGYTPDRIGVLLTSPAFLELVAHYRTEEQRDLAEFADMARNLSTDMVQELQHRMEEHPEQFTASMLGELIKVLADRSGNAPLNKTQNINVNVDMGSTMKAARERAMAVERANLIEGSAKLIATG